MESSHNTHSYTCPMHPEVVRDMPGMCPECGMNLIPISKKKVDGHQGHGHEVDVSRDSGIHKHAGHHTESFLVKFWVALVLTIPIFFYSEMARMVFNIQALEFPGSQYVFLAIGSFIFFYCGWVFIASAYRELQA